MKREIIDYLTHCEGERLVITKILKTIGSTPRKAGTVMIVHEDGRIFGTIGGGRAENEIRLQALSLFQLPDKYHRMTVRLNDDEAVREGMVCGGTLDVWLEKNY